VVDLVVLDGILRATSQKEVVNFFEETSAPPDKILATPMSLYVLLKNLQGYHFLGHIAVVDANVLCLCFAKS